MGKNKINSFLKSFIDWIKKNKILLLILFIGAVLRFYRISEYMTFLGDEGRDAIIVRRLLVEFDPILIGPGTSIGNMYLGPLYYYMMAPALALFGLSPVGPAVMVATLGVVTIALIYFIANEWFGKIAAIIASIFYAISPTVIIYSRSSWNPNIMPFFALLCVYLVWRVWYKKEFKWIPALAVSYAFALQSHYLGLLLGPTLLLFWLLTYLGVKRVSLKQTDSSSKKGFIKKSVVGVIIFSFLMSPLIIFDARHGWNNVAAMKKFFAERQTTVSARPWSAIPKIPVVATKITKSLVSAKSDPIAQMFMVVMVISLATIYSRRKSLEATEKTGYLILTVWLGVSLIGLGLYKQEIYDHYYGFFFAAPFILLGGLSQDLLKRIGMVGKVTLLAILAYLFILNISVTPIKSPPNRQLQRSEEVAEKIAYEAGGKPFNLAVIAERNYEDGYQYFLEKMNLDVRDIDAQILEETVTDQLFVICEVVPEKCSPTSSAKAEVANFGWSKVDSTWEVMGVRVFKLVHSQ